MTIFPLGCEGRSWKKSRKTALRSGGWVSPTNGHDWRKKWHWRQEWHLRWWRRHQSTASSTFNGRREGTSQGEFLRPPIREGGLGCGAGSLSRLEGDSRVVFVMYFARILEVFWGGGGVWHVLFRKCPILRSNSHKNPIFGGLPYQSSCLYAAIRHWSMHWDQIL